MTKKKYFLVRNRLSQQYGEYQYAKGELFEDTIPGLALVRVDENRNLDFKGLFLIIDIKSGLFVMRHKSKKKLLENYNEKLNYDLFEAIEKARSRDTYRERVKELQAEIENWRKSGYEVYSGD